MPPPPSVRRSACGRSPGATRPGRRVAWAVRAWSRRPSVRAAAPLMALQPAVEVGGRHRDHLKIHAVVAETAELRAPGRGRDAGIEDEVEVGDAVREDVALEPELGDPE